ncbi:hypothetical protein ACIQCG_13555 [Streptomyces noursei]|uniref:hypothetical protein n=1 Tax=Streptomyces noursei TaxID=1971 RepID=UPI0038116202
MAAAVALPASTAHAEGLPLASSIRNVESGGCVTAQNASYRDGDFSVPYAVTMENCKASDLLRQKWIYDPLTQQISSAAYPARCITNRAGFYTNYLLSALVLDPCDPKNESQKWGRFRSAFRGEYKIESPNDSSVAWKTHTIGSVFWPGYVGSPSPEERYTFTVL